MQGALLLRKRKEKKPLGVIECSFRHNYSVFRSGSHLLWHRDSLILLRRILKVQILMPKNARSYIPPICEIVGHTTIRASSGRQMLPARSFSGGCCGLAK